MCSGSHVSHVGSGLNPVADFRLGDDRFDARFETIAVINHQHRAVHYPRSERDFPSLRSKDFVSFTGA